ncbi:MAG: CbbQ/NirQ/NorQ/GpvN family protein [Gammaproteobacteria bacterium]|nr:CbbQ/NirQ/NorQ/GpvN family protein [Gammaproteobacteria bacterium]MBI5615041.1 CbbQ/NirQ/NorQ/GpvN family protein [Gammaproteobacteria bacterium]
MAFYLPAGRECELFAAACRARLPVLLKGPTGCGKSRFVEAMAERLGLALVTVACNEDTSASDLLGRYLLDGGGTRWLDGPVTRAVREGALLYLDEVAEAREDVLVVIHALTDHRRRLFIDRRDETLVAPPSFQLVVSFNPGYQRGVREMKPSTRQRFTALAFDFPDPPREVEVVRHESQCTADVAVRLVALAGQIRAAQDLGLRETVSTRLLVYAARLIVEGIPPREACRAALVEPLTDEVDVALALGDLVALRW